MSTLEYEKVQSISAMKTDDFVHYCEKCPYVTKSMFSIIDHLKHHQSTPEVFDGSCSKPEMFTCRECNFQTYETTTFNHHIKTHQMQVPVTSSQNSTSEVYHEHEPEVNNDACYMDITKKSLNCQEDFKKHSFLKNIKMSECGKYSSKRKCSQDSKQTASMDIKLFHCDKCSYTFRREHNLKAHMISKHTDLEDIEWFLCGKCSFKTKVKQYLKIHMFYEHTDLKDWKLFHCGKCPYKTSLESHIMAKHTSEDLKWFYCERCSFNAEHKRILKKHMTYTEKCAYKRKLECSVISQHTRRTHLSGEILQWKRNIYLEHNYCRLFV